MFAISVQLIAAEHRALDGRGGEGDAVALGGEVGRRDTEFHSVKPEIPVFSVCLFCTEAYRTGSAAVLAAGHYDVVIVKLCARQILGGRNADIVDAQRESAALKFLTTSAGPSSA